MLCHIEAAAPALPRRRRGPRLPAASAPAAQARAGSGRGRRCASAGARAGAAFPTAVNLAASGPAVRKLAEEKGVAPAAIQPTGKDGRATKADVMAALSSISAQPAAPAAQGPRCRPARARAPTARSGCA